MFYSIRIVLYHARGLRRLPGIVVSRSRGSGPITFALTGHLCSVIAESCDVRRRSWGATPGRPHWEQAAVTTDQITFGLNPCAAARLALMIAKSVILPT